ncbi:MAG: 2-hydroxychromene-2-carboxylate isomerase [Xanthobacteraceae bacterium]
MRIVSLCPKSIQHLGMTPPVLNFWFEFASTYSYPAMMRITSLARDAGIAVKFRPFLLGAVFKAQGWETSPFNLYASKGRNMWRDLERLCEELKLPFRRPEPFPQNSLQASRLALVGLDAQWGEDFCRSVFRAEFAEGRRIDDPAVLSELLAALNVDPDPVFAAARTDAIKANLRSQTEEALQLGIFGAPSFITMDGELFWGNDRLERAIAWARTAR